MRRRQILNVKIVYSLTEDLGFMIAFNAETQPCVQSSKSLFQEFVNVFFQ